MLADFAEYQRRLRRASLAHADTIGISHEHIC